MRQSEREARLRALCEKLYAGIWVEVGTDEPGSSFRPSRHGAVLWRLSSDTSAVRQELGSVRTALMPGAPLLMVAPKRAPLLTQLRGALAREHAPRAHLPPLCEALLLAGLLEPRVHQLFPDAWVVSATLAAVNDPLDVFFEQPAFASDR